MGQRRRINQIYIWPAISSHHSMTGNASIRALACKACISSHGLLQSALILARAKSMDKQEATEVVGGGMTRNKLT